MTESPRADARVTAGEPLDRAGAFVLLVHGRGATAESIASLIPELHMSDVAYAAPQAPDFSWYPQGFMAAIEANEPRLSASLAILEEALDQADSAGVPAERQLLLGFSQGACLVLEFAARHARRYGGVVGLTGGLIGPPGTARDYGGSLEGTPVFLGSSDPDPHVPWARVEESARVLERLGGSVSLSRYPGMGHTINREELSIARSMLEALVP